MASSPNNNPPSSSTSGSAGFMTPSSSNDTASHASAAGSNNTMASDQPREPSHQMLAFLNQSSTTDGAPYGRFASQPEAPDLQGRNAFYKARAQRKMHRYDDQSRSRER